MNLLPWAVLGFGLGAGWATLRLLARLIAPLAGAVWTDLVERYRRLSDQQHS